MKVKAPFKLSYDGYGKIRCWCYGLGNPVGWPTALKWGYNIGGSSWWLPLGVVWKLIRHKGAWQVENVGNPNFGRTA